MYNPLSYIRLAEGEGFEPPKTCALTVFKTVAFNRSAIPPMACILFHWQGERDSNPQPSVLETATLPIEPPPYSPAKNAALPYPSSAAIKIILRYR